MPSYATIQHIKKKLSLVSYSEHAPGLKNVVDSNMVNSWNTSSRLEQRNELLSAF